MRGRWAAERCEVKAKSQEVIKGALRREWIGDMRMQRERARERGCYGVNVVWERYREGDSREVGMG